MGVCVKGMYLPPSCYFCPMTNDGFYLCKANNPYKQLEDDCEERRPNWCPLIEVTEPHGRLIDADALKKVVASAKHMDADIYDGRLFYSDHLCVGADYDDVCKAIDETPTIIQASRGGLSDGCSH